MKKTKNKISLESIPGVGPSLAKDLHMLGIKTISDLKNQNPEKLYEQHCLQMGKKVDRCVLYVFRCAVYYASETDRNPRLLKWWNWKDTLL